MANPSIAYISPVDRNKIKKNLYTEQTDVITQLLRESSVSYTIFILLYYLSYIIKYATYLYNKLYFIKFQEVAL